ncbi:MAG: GIY-YIG nuclease family protein [Bacteroidota bacterium]
MKRYYVYILKCDDDSYYTGITNNINRRFAEHQSGIDKESYTYNRRPVELIYEMSFYEVTQAIAWEKKIKGWSRKKKEALIAENWDALKQASSCKNISHYENFSTTLEVTQSTDYVENLSKTDKKE